MKKLKVLLESRFAQDANERHSGPSVIIEIEVL